MQKMCGSLDNLTFDSEYYPFYSSNLIGLRRTEHNRPTRLNLVTEDIYLDDITEDDYNSSEEDRGTKKKEFTGSPMDRMTLIISRKEKMTLLGVWEPSNASNAC